MDTATHTRYGAIAGTYDAFLTFSGFRRGVENFLGRLNLDLPPRARILDAGCGTGLMTCYLAGLFPQAEISAVDIDPGMLRALERQVAERGLLKRNIIIAHGDLRRPEHIRTLKTHELIVIPKDYFDAIFVSGALEHVPLGDTVAKLARLLKPGGMFFNLGVRRNPAGAVLGMVYRFRPYRLTELRSSCETAGLDDIRVLRLKAEDFPANLSRIAVVAKKLESRI